MKRFFCSLLALLMLITTLAVPAFAVDESRKFEFSLSVDGKTEKYVSTGDVISVTFTLKRTDADEEYAMYAMQNEILYDSTFFELVEGSAMVSNGIRTTDIAMRDNDRAFYMNFTSFDKNGEKWKAETAVGTFQLRVIGTAGSSVIRSSENIVSVPGGTDQYAATAQDVTITVSDSCLIRFETNGGSDVPDQFVALGGKIQKPDDPTKDGFVLEGWYSDLDLQHKWDFSRDTVSGNMTLYAKWATETPASFNFLWLLLILLILLVITLIVMGRKNARHRIMPSAAKQDEEQSDKDNSEKEET